MEGRQTERKDLLSRVANVFVLIGRERAPLGETICSN